MEVCKKFKIRCSKFWALVALGFAWWWWCEDYWLYGSDSLYSEFRCWTCVQGLGGLGFAGFGERFLDGNVRVNVLEQTLEAVRLTGFPDAPDVNSGVFENVKRGIWKSKSI